MAASILSTKVPEIMSTMWCFCCYLLVNMRLFSTVFTPEVNKYFQKVMTKKVKVLVLHFNLLKTVRHLKLPNRNMSLQQSPSSYKKNYIWQTRRRFYLQAAQRLRAERHVAPCLYKLYKMQHVKWRQHT